MRGTLITALTLGLMLSAAAADAEDMKKGGEAMNHDTMARGSHTPSNAEAEGVGVVNSVDPDKNMINITHEPMPALGWPEMTMDLPATKHVDLSGVKPGSKVDFKIKLGRDKKYRVIEIAPAK